MCAFSQSQSDSRPDTNATRSRRPHFPQVAQISEERLELLVQMQQRMLRPIIWAEEAAEILEAIITTVGAEGGVLWRLAPDTSGMTLNQSGAWGNTKESATFDLTRSELKERLQEGEEIWLPSTSDSPENIGHWGATEGNGSLLMPLASRDQMLGVLTIHAPVQEVLANAGGREFLRVIAGSLAMALERSLFQRKLKESQANLRQAQKMDAIGQFAGGIAHDFNNILTVIKGGMVLLREKLPPNASSLEMADEVIEAANRAKTLTQQLLTFTHKRKLETAEIDINAVARGFEPMLARLLGETIRLEHELCEEPLITNADANLIEQVLMNLAANARDAMPEGGVLTIRTQSRSFSPGQTGLPKNRKPQTYACITIEDTGTGIPPEVREHIFEPFFTTKPVGKGTGLGLASVYAILQQHQGWAVVDSEIGTGTTVRLFFPIHEGAPSTPADPTPSPAPSPASPHAQITILLVEDEESVLRLASMVLESVGYKVIPATSGPEAVTAWQQCKDEVSLLITDIVMPQGMSGIELAKKLSAEKPDLKVILASGYSPDLDQVPANALFLQKPYEVEDLKATIASLLGSKARPPNST